MKLIMKTLVPGITSDESKLPEGINNAFIKAVVSALTILNAVKNNIRYIHWHVVGPKFKEVHELTDEYYKLLDSEYDYIAELHLRYGLHVGNPLTDYFRGFEEWMDEYNYPTAIHQIRYNLYQYLIHLKDARAQLESLHLEHSKIDEMIDNWDKELNYKLDRML